MAQVSRQGSRRRRVVIFMEEARPLGIIIGLILLAYAVYIFTTVMAIR